MQGVKAIGVLANGRAQVSMNITDFRLTPLPQVQANVEQLAKLHGTSLADGELIGLIPEEAYDEHAEWIQRIPDFDPNQKILERKLELPMLWPKV
jgi:glutamate formiminotransferase